MTNALLKEWREKTQELIGEVNSIAWTSDSRGFLVCPFKHLHTTKGAPRDTAIYLDDFPHIHCLHESCREPLREVNRFLRIQITGHSKVETEFKRPQTRGAAEFMRKNREMLLEKYEDKVRKIANGLPLSSAGFIWQMFNRRDWVWVGNPEMTGPGWPTNFREANCWLASPPPPAWAFICPNPLMKEGCDRKNENISEYKHLVLESDTLNMFQTRTMFEAVEDIFLLKLKAIVFSGNKSLHGWFEHPGLEWLDNNRALLIAMGFDASSMRPSQPVRLPGVIRENGKKQALLWLKG